MLKEEWDHDPILSNRNEIQSFFELGGAD